MPSEPSKFPAQLSSFFDEQRSLPTPDWKDPSRLATWLEGRTLSDTENAYAHSQALAFYERGGSEVLLSSELTDFLRQLLQQQSPANFVDPWVGLGKTLEALLPFFPAATFEGISRSQDWTRLLKALYPDAQLQEGEYPRLLASSNTRYDAAVTVPPFAMKAQKEISYQHPNGEEISLKTREVAEQVILSAGCRLAEGGKLYAIVSTGLLSGGSHLLESLALFNLYVEGAIELPPKSFGIQAGILGTLLIISNTDHGKIFRARLSDSREWNTQIAENYLARRDDPGELTRGVLGGYDHEQTLDRIQHEKQCSHQNAMSEGLMISLGDLSTKIVSGKPDANFEFPEHANAIYLAKIGRRDVATRPEDIGIKLQNIVQVQIPADGVAAQFVKQALNSDFGRQQRELLKTGATIPSLSLSSIRLLKVVLPPLSVQKDILGYESDLAIHEASILGLQNDLEEMRRRIWSQMKVDKTALSSLTRLSQQLSQEKSDESNLGLESWIETLPFPLASILRTWQACDPAEHELRYKHLLHFFEAAAQFMSLILLSGFQRDPEFYEQHREDLLKRIGGAGSSLERPCFGTWKTIRASLGKVVGKLTNFNGKKQTEVEENEKQSLKLFADPTHQLPQTVSNTKFAELFDMTCRYRNEWTAHAGLIDPKLASKREQELYLYLEKFRNLCGGLWDHTLLFKPESSRNKSGSHHHKVKILRGSNPTFLQEDRIFDESLDTEALYLVSESSNEALLLLPLIRMDASPPSTKNTCYFYLRSSSQGEVTFVSYHHQQEEEFKGQYDEVGNAIRSLTEGFRKN